MRAQMLQKAPAVCGTECAECTQAGADRPSVLLAATPSRPKGWLHGRDLMRWWAARDREAAGRQSIGDQLRADHLERTKNRINQVPGLHAQRGDEPR